MEKYREVHIHTRHGNYYRFGHCEVEGNSERILIKEGDVTTVFPTDAIELISLLEKDEKET